MGEIRPCIMSHIDRYGEIYAKAFFRISMSGMDLDARRK